jgi:2-C-methyl-D-erythritol 4-phosphate cytidylyltransferase
MISYSLDAYEKCPDIDGVVVVVAKEKLEVVANMVRLFGCAKVRRIVGGTTKRYGSILNALKSLDEEVTLVSIHDVSRPCVSPELISETVRAAKRYGSGVSAVRVEDAIKDVEKGLKASKDHDRSRLWATQTPQTFKRELLEKGLEASNKKKITLDDDAQALTTIKQEIHLVPSTTTNMKVRTADDMVVVSALLRVI